MVSRLLRPPSPLVTVTVRLPDFAVATWKVFRSNFSNTHSRWSFLRSVETTVMPLSAAAAESG